VPVDGVARRARERLRSDVVLLDRDEIGADEPQEQRREQTGAVLAADAVEECSAVGPTEKWSKRDSR
jgi:hypothetical protein